MRGWLLFKLAEGDSDLCVQNAQAAEVQCGEGGLEWGWIDLGKLAFLNARKEWTNTVLMGAQYSDTDGLIHAKRH
jgi:hypothetical protein